MSKRLKKKVIQIERDLGPRFGVGREDFEIRKTMELLEFLRLRYKLCVIVG